VSIRFLDAEGIDITEAAQRKIERTFYREDFRRCLASEIGDLRYPLRVPDFYAQTLLQQVDVGSIRAARFKVVLDYAYGATTFVMPLVLGKLGAEVLSLNPYAAAQQSVQYDRWEHACSVSTLVRTSAADFGVVLSPDGERLTLVDDTGRILSGNEGLMVLLALVLRHDDGGRGHGGATVALPVSAPSAAEEMCRRAGASLVSTKMAASHLMEAASAPGVQFAAGQEGGYIFPAFLPAFDAVAALAHTFALLAATGARLSAVVAGLPPVWTAHESVVTPWEKKGLVMRSVMALGRERPAVLVDGVKLIHDDGWCLIVPDPEEALTHVWAEGPSEAEARARVREQAASIGDGLG